MRCAQRRIDEARHHAETARTIARQDRLKVLEVDALDVLTRTGVTDSAAQATRLRSQTGYAMHR